MSIQNLLEKLSLEELKQLKSEFQNGKVDDTIQKKTIITENKTCAVCGESFSKNTGLVLEFGSSDFRRRAHFCALDCMEYFTENLKKKGGAYY